MKSRHDYQSDMERLLESLEREGRAPTLLLQDCCAPCGSYVIGLLSGYFRVTVLFYNPNIYPESEYRKRLGEVRRLLGLMETKYPVELMECPYDAERFCDCVAGYEAEPEGGARCTRCFRLRLGETARLARERGFEYFATTLSVSPHKNADLLNAIGEEWSRETGVRYLASDFKKRDGYKKSILLSRQYGLYRQDYCGCEFSLRGRGDRQTEEGGERK